MKNEIVALIIHALAPSFWPTQLESGFKEELARSGLNMRYESLYLPQEGSAAALSKIDAMRPDVILVANEPDDPALIKKIMLRKTPTFFASIPKDITALDWIKPEWKDYQSGVFGTFKAADSIRILQQFVDVKTVGVIGTSNKTIKDLAYLISDQLSLNDAIKVHTEIEDDYESWKKKVIQLNAKADAVFTLYPYGLKRSSGAVIEPAEWPEIGAFLRLNLTKPTLAIGSMQAGSIDRLLGLIIDPHHIGVQVAYQVYAHANGKAMKDIGFEQPVFHDLQIMMSEINRLGLRLPEDFYCYANLF